MAFSGTLLIIFGLNASGLIHIDILNTEKRLNINLDTSKMTYLKAFLMGFLFTFAWSPCIGPMLASAIIIASSQTLGSLYILVYALGLIIPFLITGLFTSSILNFLKNKKKIFKYVMIVAGLILIIYGGYMIINSAKEVTSVNNNTATNVLPKTKFKDQNDKTIDLKDYKDKYVFINCAATWCTYCIEEIPYYNEFANKGDDYVCLYLMSPLTSGVSKEELIEFINDMNIELPVLIDEDNTLENYLKPAGYPTTYVLDKNGELIGYIAGALNLNGFEQLLENVKENY